MDIAFLKALEEIRTPALNLLFQFITLFGEEVVLIAALCLIYWCVNKRMATYILFNFFIIGLLVQALKITFCVPRPWMRDPTLSPVATAIAGASGFSFPSGHTASSVAMYGSLAMWFRRKGVTVCCCLMIALIMMSRLYLGVHTPQDVLTSLMVGTALLYGGRGLFSQIEREPRAANAAFWCGIALAVVVAAYAEFKPYPDMDGIAALVLDTYKVCGAAIGLFVGWQFEVRLVHFNTDGTLSRRALKYALGMALIGALLALKGPSAMLGDKAWAVIKYALIAFAVLGLWPMAFTKWLTPQQTCTTGTNAV